LSVMIPDDEWNRVGRLRRFVLARCDLNQTVDIAICRLKPADNIHDLDYLHPAQVGFRPPVSREPVWLTGFTGWLMVPLVRAGHVIGEEAYRTQDGCRCNFATDIVAVEGMSGSPIISLDGEVVGIITQAGRGNFRGISFGTSLREVRDFLAAHGLVSQSPKVH